MTIRMTCMICSVAIAVLSLGGCQESETSDSALIQRARLVGNENIKLKSELEQKNEQILQLQAEIEQIKNEHEEADRTSGEANLRILQLLAETQKINEELRQENEQLKTRLETQKSQ